MLFNKWCNKPRQNFGCCCQPQPCQPQVCCQDPVIEPTVNECIVKESFSEVPHIVPIHTHVVNKHFVKHSYTPQYSCSEETQVIDVGCGDGKF